MSEELPPPDPAAVPIKARSKSGATDLRRDPATMKRLEEALIAGNTYRNAAILAGISERTFFKWKAQGRRAKPGGRSLAAQFMQLVEKAEAQAIHRNVMVIQKASAKNWQAAAWYLERKFPQDWARRDFLRSELTGAGGGPIQTQNQNLNANVPQRGEPPISEEEHREILKRTYERTFGLLHTERPQLDDGTGSPAGTPAAAAS